jgi:glutaryl-CoA dehydrogenase
MTDQGVRGFLVEKGTPGYTTRDIPHKFSLRASVTSELFFDNCKIPESNRLPKAEGLGAPLSCLTQARYGIAWGGVGANGLLRGRWSAATVSSSARRSSINSINCARRHGGASRQVETSLCNSAASGRRRCITHISLAKWNNVRLGLDPPAGRDLGARHRRGAAPSPHAQPPA